jgi:hypothetical protein
MKKTAQNKVIMVCLLGIGSISLPLLIPDTEWKHFFVGIGFGLLIATSIYIQLLINKK